MNSTAGTVVVQFDANLYSAEAVQRAAFRLEESAAADIWREGDTVGVVLTPRQGAQSIDPSVLAESFKRAVLDEQLRARVLEQTRQIRQTLIDAAFRSAAAKPHPPSDT